jgi:hypothetical protein
LMTQQRIVLYNRTMVIPINRKHIIC